MQKYLNTTDRKQTNTYTKLFANMHVQVCAISWVCGSIAHIARKQDGDSNHCIILYQSFKWLMSNLHKYSGFKTSTCAKKPQHTLTHTHLCVYVCFCRLAHASCVQQVLTSIHVYLYNCATHLVQLISDEIWLLIIRSWQ